MNPRHTPSRFKRDRNSVLPIKADLDGYPLVATLTAFLRSPNSGRLNVLHISRLYAQPLGRFASALGVPLATLRRRPDHKSFQNYLGRFEQTARILPFIRNRAAFAEWAETPNAALNGAMPIDLLWGSREVAEQLVFLVEEVLTDYQD
jgi:uncharacterized protein (DUF2384 family)